MYFRNYFIYLLNKLSSSLQDPCPVLRELHIPYVQSLRESWLPVYILKQGISLIDDSVIIRKIAEIYLVEL